MEAVVSKRRNICSIVVYSTGFNLWLSSKESTCDTGDTWFDLLEEEMAIHSSILAKKIPLDRGAWWATVHGKELDMTAHTPKHGLLHNTYAYANPFFIPCMFSVSLHLNINVFLVTS